MWDSFIQPEDIPEKFISETLANSMVGCMIPTDWYKNEI
jgi:hypothetical protein